MLDWIKLLPDRHAVGLADKSGTTMLQFVELYRTRDPAGYGNRYFWMQYA